MTTTVRVDIPLNRVEGDLTIRVEIESGIVKDAWSSGTLYRGFEKLMEGRGVMDGLVITPRVCGICSTAHLTAACLALENMAHAEVPPNATRIRNVALLVEQVQSDLRHGVLMFLADFTNPAYSRLPQYQESLRRFTPLKGDTVVETVRQTRKLLEVIGILGGQWPHSTFMVPGGIASAPSAPDLLQCRILIENFRKWYEARILGCTLERWSDVKTASDLEAWLEESESHRNSDLGFYIQFSKDAGLHKLGAAPANFLSFGACPIPEAPSNGARQFIPSGFIQNGVCSSFDESGIYEDTSHAWYADAAKGGARPIDSDAHPYASGYEGNKYTWIKAPRYNGQPAETGPLAEMVIQQDSLILDLMKPVGASVFVREFARLIRPSRQLPMMDLWLAEAMSDRGDYYRSPGPIVEGTGIGLTEATRGALGHWVKAENGRITHYQMIPPTSWNGSPRDERGTRGPWEQALIGVEIPDSENPLNIGHVIRSFDACLVCSVHRIGTGGSGAWIRI